MKKYYSYKLPRTKKEIKYVKYVSKKEKKHIEKTKNMLPI
jgi:hypothetical protein